MGTLSKWKECIWKGNWQPSELEYCQAIYIYNLSIQNRPDRYTFQVATSVMQCLQLLNGTEPYWTDDHCSPPASLLSSRSLQIHLKLHVAKCLWVRFVTDFSLVLPCPQPPEHHCSVPRAAVMLPSFRFSFQGAMPTHFLLWKDEWKVLNPNTLSSSFYHILFPDVKTGQLSLHTFQI